MNDFKYWATYAIFLMACYGIFLGLPALSFWKHDKQQREAMAKFMTDPRLLRNDTVRVATTNIIGHKYPKKELVLTNKFGKTLPFPVDIDNTIGVGDRLVIRPIRTVNRQGEISLQDVKILKNLTLEHNGR